MDGYKDVNLAYHINKYKYIEFRGSVRRIED